jgi:PTS system nitrogen regulatory IIA component
MILEDLIKPDSVLCNAHARSKKHCLEIMSELLARPVPDIANEDIFHSLVERERLGCTGLDRGVAFPHCRVAGLTSNVGALIKLSEPVEFDSPDGDAVDLVFGLVVPDTVDESLHADIARIALLLSDQDLRQKLREATSSAELYATIIGSDPPVQAAEVQAVQTS